MVHGDVPRSCTARLGLTVAGALVHRGVLTAGLLGADALAAEYLTLLPDLLPMISQVALFDPDDRAADDLLDRLVVPLRHRGVQLCVSRHLRDVVRGTDLVLLTDAVHAAALRAGWLATGTVVLHLGARRLPVPLRAAADVLVTAADPGSAPEAVLLAPLARWSQRARLIVVDLPAGCTCHPTGTGGQTE